LLALLAEYFIDFQKLSGANLVEGVLKQHKEFKFEPGNGATEGDGDEEAGGEKKRFRIGQLRACSFRGLAPAGRIWDHNFVGQSHLLYGPNGCGKSSLLGAICWCLTGRVFRDDCEPSEPEKIKAYPADGANTGQVERDDAQALIDAEGNSSSVSEPYWVEVQLLSENDESNTTEVWLRRKSDEGLSRSDDGIEWSAICSVMEIGIDEVDAELHLLMPAKVSHLKFGKNPDLVHLLAEIVGYGNLETIAGVAENLGRNARTVATKTETQELRPEDVRLVECVEQIKSLANEAIKELPSYMKVCEESRNCKDIEEFGKTIAARVEARKAQLATDVGIEVPEEGAEEYKEWQEKRNNLPGQVSNLLSELEKPLREIFPISIGLETPPVEILETMEEKLKVFEQEGAQEIEERLAWAKKCRTDEKARLMLKAAAYFPDGSNNCPVCTQALDRVPEVKSELEQLRTISSKDHLQKDIEDHERSLIGRLDVIVSPEQRMEGEKSFGARMRDDWIELKNGQCKGLLLEIAERFDDGVMQVAAEVQEVNVEPFTIPSESEEQFCGAFSDYGEALCKAKQYVELCKSVSSNRDTASEELRYLLKESRVDSEAGAFKEILERGRGTNEELKALEDIHAKTGELWKSAKNVEKFRERIKNLTEIANCADYIKALKISVRKEVIGLVEGEVGERTKSYYELLYENEVLKFEKLTPGHAGNPDIKDEINLYLRAGRHLVPMGPYSNAGRMRALILSFVFALLEKSCGSLGFVILDDPATSLDSAHKAKLVNRIIGKMVGDQQLVLATHYERFYELSKRVFVGKVVEEMVPLRGNNEVSFEAGDILERINSAFQDSPGIWRELAGNLRIWIERSMETLNGYSPIRFRRRDDLVGTIRDYGMITDPRIEGQNQRCIVGILTRDFIDEIRRLCHGEDAQVEEFEDALTKLMECKKQVDEEIMRLKKLYQADLEALAIQPRVQIITLEDWRSNSVDSIIVLREAAASHNAQGIEWNLSDEYRLEGYSVVLLRSEVISPIALPGQYLVLDWEEREPERKDLVIVETNDGKRYVRRIWIKEDKTILLEDANPTKPYEPVHVVVGNCKVRRIVGVLYDNVQIPLGGEGEEWVPASLCDGWFDRIVGVRVYGTSLEPVARNGQIVLIEKTDLKGTILNDMLACVSVRDEGDFIKRCYVKESQCILCAVNQTEREAPIAVDMEAIQQVYPLKGILFEVGLGSSVE